MSSVGSNTLYPGNPFGTRLDILSARTSFLDGNRSHAICRRCQITWPCPDSTVQSAQTLLEKSDQKLANMSRDHQAFRQIFCQCETFLAAQPPPRLPSRTGSLYAIPHTSNSDFRPLPPFNALRPLESRKSKVAQICEPCGSPLPAPTPSQFMSMVTSFARFGISSF
jgi:hypothetical protein